MLAERGDPQECRFSAAVRTEHHPVLTGLDDEIDPVEDVPPIAYHGDAAELHDTVRGHTATLAKSWLSRLESEQRNRVRENVSVTTEAERIEREFAAVTGLIPTQATPLAGGASRVTWQVVADDRRFVVQAARGDTERDMLGEFELLVALSKAGLPIAEPLAAGSPAGRAVLVSAHVEGETFGVRVLRGLDEMARDRLAAQFARSAADIHRLGTDAASKVGALERGIDQLATYGDIRLALAPDRPVLALAERWLLDHPPEPHSPVLCHGDLRLGNLIIDNGELAAVIDWELAHFGHPAEDLGWCCVRAWRFGGPGAALGCVDRSRLLDEYHRAGGTPIDRETLRYHEVLGTWKWGLMCLLQAEAHLSGVVDDLEMLAIGRRVVENEYDVLRLLGWHPRDSQDGATAEDFDADRVDLRLPAHLTGIVPRLDDLQSALDRDVGETTEYRRRLRVSVGEMIGRERRVASRLTLNRRRRLDRLGFPDHRSLADEIVGGQRPVQAELLATLGEEVLDQLRVVNPGYVGRVDDVV